MRAADFLREFDDEQFPAEVGPRIGVDFHDPPFLPSQLKSAERMGLIVMSADGSSYRLTLKATKNRAKAQGTER